MLVPSKLAGVILAIAEFARVVSTKILNCP